MRIILSDFMSLDGVVQAPGGGEEDTDGGFAHGGWSMPYFDPETMGSVIDEVMTTTEALLFGRRTWQAMAASWCGRGSTPPTVRRSAARPGRPAPGRHCQRASMSLSATLRTTVTPIVPSR